MEVQMQIWKTPILQKRKIDMQDFTLFRGKPYQDLTLDDLKEVEFNTIEEVNRFYNYYGEGPFPNDEGYDGASHSDDN
ncbi:hypothetical protein RchiOBHm_Chr2g0100541 [Rosa chinensis]|uniref:Uncharacterized protein n=1 Tax=Rosa chinensis TaxID=74649 RepID=A0A2P6RM67_ROSCH|nr:hypothetical protein RchiOBHm_Chr2g0100541 [Rosa chinensis]